MTCLPCLQVNTLSQQRKDLELRRLMRLGTTCPKRLQPLTLFLSHSPDGDGDGQEFPLQRQEQGQGEERIQQMLPWEEESQALPGVLLTSASHSRPLKGLAPAVRTCLFTTLNVFILCCCCCYCSVNLPMGVKIQSLDDKLWKADLGSPSPCFPIRLSTQ